MKKYISKSIYRNFIITSLLKSTNGYSISEIAELFELDKKIIREDIVIMLKNGTNCIEFFDADYYFDEEDEDEETITYNDVLNGKIDNEKLWIDGVLRGEIELSLTNEEFDVLDNLINNTEILENRFGRNSIYKIKNGIRGVKREDVQKDLILFEKMANKEPVEIAYSGKNGTSFFDVLFVKRIHNIDNGLIYYIDNEGTTRRLDKIHSIKPSKKKIETVDISHENDATMWEATGGDIVHVKVKFYDEAGVIKRVKNELGEKADKLSIGESFATYEDDIIGIGTFGAWVRSYGSSAIVLEPQSLREKMIESAKRRLEYYS